MSKNKAIVPTECYACHNIIEVGQTIINHHISYFPENIVKVHGGCHTKIHGFKSKFPYLKPNPAQVRRWYSKKGSIVSNYYLYANDFDWLRFIDCVENGFMTEERKEKIKEEQLLEWIKESDRIYKIKLKMNIKQTWSSCD